MDVSERIVIAAVLGLLVLRALVATVLPLHGDEAFYWWESRHPALGYSDLPPLTAWVLALTAVDAAGYLGVRWAFLLAGAALPLAVWGLARELWPPRPAAGAALAALAIPLVGLQGLLALPDVLLNLLAVLLAWSLVRALRGRERAWLAAGLCLALGFATHPRFAVPALAAAMAVLATGAGRRALRRPRRPGGPWAALGLGLLGVVPTLVFNLRHDWAMLGFQLAERHPWRLQPAGLAQPVVQLVVTTPFLWVALLLAAVALVRRSDAAGGPAGSGAAQALGTPVTVLACFGLLPPLFYFLVGLFADQDRVGFHWPLVGHLVLCAGLPLLRGRRVRRWLLGPGVAMGLATTVAVLAFLLLLARAPEREWRSTKLLPVNLLAWPEVAAAVPAGAPTIVADNFMLAAELAFELGRPDVRVLRHPRNAEHGRAAQLALWELDGPSHPASGGILVVEETALPPAERPAWARALCARFPRTDVLAELSFLGERRRFRVHRYGPDAGRCDHPAFAYVDAPRPGEVIRSPFTVRGWAFDEDEGIGRIEILLDGRPVAVDEARSERADVGIYFGGLRDPDLPRIGFRATVAAPPGRHDLQLRLTGRDGAVRTLPARRIVVREE